MDGPGKKIKVSEFIAKTGKIPVIDVRSPGEYIYGHIPGAVNIPLFNNDEREIIGTVYKKEGRQKAILKGLDIVGGSMASKLKIALNVAVDGKLLVHCWRGGMRSEAMSWLFSLGDIVTEILEGGYKSYRNHVLKKLAEKHNYFILGGLTGSGKTEILRYLKKTGHQVIDLEGIACHRGSAFGSLGQDKQPTSEHFANLLYDEMRKMNNDRPIWLEDESRNIGSVFMPDEFYNNMQESPAIALIMDVSTRMPRLLDEYTKYPADELKASVMRISKRLGGVNTSRSLESIDSGNFSKAVEITLDYYDRAYLHGIKRKQGKKIRFLKSDVDDIEKNAAAVLELYNKFQDN